MFNVLGQLVYSYDNNLTPNAEQITINTNNLASGLYLLKVNGINFQSDRKIFILK